MRAVMLTCALGLAACVGSSSDQGALRADDVSDDVGGDDDDGEPEVCEVTPDAIGVVGEVPTHGTTLEVVEWVPRRNSTDAFVGFELSRLARFTVRAGGIDYPAEGTSWIHPRGDTGAAITGIDFCDDYCEDEGDDGGGSDDGGGDGGPVVD